MTTGGPEARRLGLGWALEEFGAWLAKWRRVDEVTDDVDDLAVYVKDEPRGGMIAGTAAPSMERF